MPENYYIGFLNMYICLKYNYYFYLIAGDKYVKHMRYLW